MAEGTEKVKPAETIGDLPDSPIASPPAGQSLDQAGDSAVDFEKILSHPDFQAALDKKVQSVKDVRFGKMETEVGDLRKAITKYDSLVKQGLSPDQAVAQMEGEDKLGKLETQVASLLGGNKPEASTGVGELDWAGKQASILENAGIAKDDPRIVELLRTATSKQDFVVKLEEQTFAWKQADANKPVPGPGTVAQITPSVPTGDGKYTAEKYKENMLAAQGKPSEIRQIKADARKDGVDVDNIGFGS